MSRAYTLYKRYSQEQLVAMDRELCAPYQDSSELYSPAGNTPCANGLYLYPRKVRDKRDAIARAISWHLEDTKKKVAS